MIYTEMTKKALKLCFEAHRDQVDKSGMPYVFHPFHLAEQMTTEETVTAALLHDVAEDTDYTVDDLAAMGFPETVTDALRLLTHDRAVPYMEYVARLKPNPVARAVKLADLRHNSDMSRLDRVDEYAQRRAEKYRKAIALLSDEDAADRTQADREGKMTEPDGKSVPDRIRGCLIGGAAGDALGYEVEFRGEEEIFSLYGPGGIQRYEKDPVSGKALISDDTQMTLFTACGILFGKARFAQRGVAASPAFYVSLAYQDWLFTQKTRFRDRGKTDGAPPRISWLLDVPELYSPRAPGNTCLSALEQQRGGGPRADIEHPLNRSKGCGGVMRVAPMGLAHSPDADIRTIDREGAELAAITHGHSLGYMPAAVLTHIISRIVYPERPMTLREIVREAIDTVAEIFASDAHTGELKALLESAMALTENGADDLENIHQLGEGWVGDEALAIAIYCALRYQDDFSAGLVAAVNHRGDSDSTGAVAGNILGAWVGFDAIDAKWKEDLELYDVILKTADGLSGDCASCTDPASRDPEL